MIAAAKAAAFTVAGLVLIADLLSQTMGTLIILAGGLGAVGWLFRHVLSPFAQLIKRAFVAYDVLEALPDTLRGIDARLAGLEQKALLDDERSAAIHRELGIEHRDVPTRPHIDIDAA